MQNIPLIKPYMTDEIKAKVCQVLEGGYLTEGDVTRAFENACRQYIGCDYAIATTSCTTGLEIALRALEIGPGDEVIVPDYTYPATASVVAILGATAVLVDVSPETMLIDYGALEHAITEKTKAIVPVSIFGNPLNYERLDEIKSKYGIHIIEDAACSLGAQYKETPVGGLADISVFSFHPRKFITTGEGGMVVTNKRDWAEWMNSYKHFGMGDQMTSRGGVRFERVGTNYKLSNILAAVGLVQMKDISLLLAQRKKLAEHYKGLLSGQPGIGIPKTTKGGKHSWQSFCVFVDNRDEVIRHLRGQGIETQIGTYSLHMHRAYREGSNVRIAGSMEGSCHAFEKCLTLPLFHDMTQEEQGHVVGRLLESLD